MPLDQVKEDFHDSDSSSPVDVTMPSPTLSASSENEEVDEEEESKDVPCLQAADSWEDDDEGESEEQKDNSGNTCEPESLSIITKMDDFLTFWNDWSASSLRSDQGLKLLQWSFWGLSRLTALGPPMPGYRGNFNRRYVHPELSPALRKMYFDLSLVRYALRLYGFPSSIEAIRSGSWSAGWEDPRVHKLGKVMAWSMAFYYPFEHVAFTGWVVPKLVKPYIYEERWSAISCRFWLTYIVADLASSVLKLKELAKQKETIARDLQDGAITKLEVCI